MTTFMHLAADMHHIDLCQALLMGIVDTGFDRFARSISEGLNLLEEAYSKKLPDAYI